MVAKKYQNPSGGLNEAGRKYFKRTTGANLKRPSKKVGNKRRASFCARMKGMKKKLTSAKTANDPNSEDLYNLGLCFEALGDYGLALLNYRAAHQIDQTNLIYAKGIGRIENLQRQFPQLRSQIQSRKL